MAHFAKLDENNIVLEVIVVSNDDINDLPFPDSEPVGIQFISQLSTENSNWKQTSYNNNFRKNYAGIGYTYDVERDAFIAPKEYASWVLNEDTCRWEFPVPYPEDGNDYRWDEDTISWVLVENENTN
jgi:hypothetical protein